MRIRSGLLLLTAIVLLAPSGGARAADPNFRAGGAVLRSGASPASAAAPATLRITELQLTTQVAFGRPVDSVTRFAPTQTAIHAWFAYAGAAPSAELTGRLVLLAPAGEIEARTLKTSLAKAEDVGSLRFSVEPDPWPEGRYRLDLSSGGAKLRSIEFEVRKSP